MLKCPAFTKEYAALFAQSKLKVEAARAAGLDTTTVFRKQHEKRRTELVESYLIDKQVMDSCARVLLSEDGIESTYGRVQVMQIFKRLPQTVTSRHLEEEKARMDSIYRVIQNQPDLNFNHLLIQDTGTTIHHLFVNQIRFYQFCPTLLVLFTVVYCLENKK